MKAVLVAVVMCLLVSSALAVDVESGEDRPRKNKAKTAPKLVAPTVYEKDYFMPKHRVIIVPKGDPRARAPAGEIAPKHHHHHHHNHHHNAAAAAAHFAPASATSPAVHVLKAGAVTSSACAKIGGQCTTSCANGKVTHGLCAGAPTCCVPNRAAAPVAPRPVAPVAPSSGGAACMNTIGINMIKSFEGFSGKFYRDSVGVLTIGYGHACQPDSACNNIKAPISEPAAASMLASELTTRYGPCMKKSITRALNNNQYSALTSFVYNLGCGILRGSLLSDLNAGNFAAAAKIMLQYNHAGGKVLAGLTRRRQAEANLLLKAPTGNDNVCFH